MSCRSDEPFGQSAALIDDRIAFDLPPATVLRLVAKRMNNDAAAHGTLGTCCASRQARDLERPPAHTWRNIKAKAVSDAAGDRCLNECSPRDSINQPPPPIRERPNDNMTFSILIDVS
jgi:hypothetical protein